MPARIALLVAAIGVAAAPAWARPASSSGPAVSGHAGLGGVARQGRWMPVSAQVKGGDAGFNGTLVVTWGDASVSRSVSAGPGITVDVDLLIRAMTATTSVRLSLVGSDPDANVSADLPVAVLRDGEPLVACVGHRLAGCQVTLTPENVPGNWRGLDAADQLAPAADAWPDWARRSAALRVWRLSHWLNNASTVDPPRRPISTASDLERQISIVAVGVVVTVFALAAAGARWRWHWSALLIFPVAAGMAATAFLSASAVTVVHTSGVVHSFQGEAESIVELESNVQHGGRGALVIDHEWVDALITIPGATETRHETADGKSQYRNNAALGAWRRFRTDATLRQPWLSAHGDGSTVELVNAGSALSDCVWQGRDETRVGDLPSGGRRTIALASRPEAGDAAICRAPQDWPRWSSAGRIKADGDVFVVLHFWSENADPSAAR